MFNIKKARTVLLFSALFVIFLVIGTALKDDEEKVIVPQQKKEEPVSDNANLKLENVTYSTVNENNDKVWDLKADSVNVFKDQDLMSLEGVSVTLYSEGKPYYLTSDFGEFNTKTRDIKIKGGVEGVLPDSTQIRTETLEYNHQQRTMTTKDKISIKRGTISIEGVGVIININEKKLLILDKVRASQNDKK